MRGIREEKCGAVEEGRSGERAFTGHLPGSLSSLTPSVQLLSAGTMFLEHCKGCMGKCLNKLNWTGGLILPVVHIALVPVVCLVLDRAGGSKGHHSTAPKQPEQEEIQAYFHMLEPVVGLWQGRGRVSIPCELRDRQRDSMTLPRICPEGPQL